MLLLEKYSFGIGDRFGQQARAQLCSFQMLAEQGVEVTPVWNKSNREHTFIGSDPASVRSAAQAAVTASGWTRSWHVDADHIRHSTVDRFLASSDFFTIDVADSIGQPAAPAAVSRFADRHPELVGELALPGLREPLILTRAAVEQMVAKYLLAAAEAGRIYKQIEAGKTGTGFIAEVSMDETDSPQTPAELLVILAALADEGVQLQTIAPKFTGRFNKGVDYVGNLAQFEREFHEDLAVIAHAVKQYGLPPNLKLSIHSGSDKFSLYPIIRQALRDTGAGIHVKTAGTTWLEELIGLAESGETGRAVALEIYEEALNHIDELCGPYAAVIDIARNQLPSADLVRQWPGSKFASALRHVPAHPDFNPHMRQLLHVAFKLAAKKGETYLQLLRDNEAVVSRNVVENLYQRHLRPLFVDPVLLPT